MMPKTPFVIKLQYSDCKKCILWWMLNFRSQADKNPTWDDFGLELEKTSDFIN